MKKVYLVTTGEYSDYSVRGVYSNLKRAEEVQKYYNKSSYCDACIEIIDLDTNFYRIRDGYLRYHFYMGRRGGVYHLSSSGLRHGHVSFWYEFYNESQMVCEVDARSEEHAIKIANEKRVQLLAMNLWGINRESLEAESEGKT